MAEINEINGDLDHFEEHRIVENGTSQRFRQRAPDILQRKILSRDGTVRGMRHRVRVGIAAFSGGNDFAKAMVRGVPNSVGVASRLNGRRY
jgi:hypothetical protein